jgi:hypothetical protein
LGHTHVVTGPEATTTGAGEDEVAGATVQVLGHTQGWNWATTGAVLQVLGHTQGRNWAVAWGAGVAVRNVARIKVIMVMSPYERL